MSNSLVKDGLLDSRLPAIGADLFAASSAALPERRISLPEALDANQPG